MDFTARTETTKTHTLVFDAPCDIDTGSTGGFIAEGAPVKITAVVRHDEGQAPWLDAITWHAYVGRDQMQGPDRTRLAHFGYWPMPVVVAIALELLQRFGINASLQDDGALRGPVALVAG